MQSLISSYLLQSKECILPGIGILQVKNLPAVTDVANNGILPPSQEILFNEATYSESPGLVKYIADKGQIQQGEAAEILNSYCKEWKQKIDAGGKLTFEAVGSLQKNEEGLISFVKEEKDFYFFQPIYVNDSYQKIKEPLLVDEEPVLQEEVVLEENVVVEKSHWLIWAAALFAIGVLMIFFQFKGEKLTGGAIGNKNYFIIEPETPTYKIPK